MTPLRCGRRRWWVNCGAGLGLLAVVALGLLVALGPAGMHLHPVPGRVRLIQQPTHRRYQRGDAENTTLCTLLDYERRDRLLKLAGRWPGHLAAGVHLDRTIEAEFVAWAGAHEAELQNTTLALLITDKAACFPANQLRNLAIGTVVTDLFVVVDADMLPGTTFHPEAQTDIAAYVRDTHQCRRTVLIPCFGLRDSAPRVYPHDRRELLAAIEAGTVLTGDKLWGYSQGIVTYPQWLTTTEPFYEVWPGYYTEPYMVLCRSNSIPYDERMCGIGGDRQEQMKVFLDTTDLRYFTSALAFVIHMPHESVKGLFSSFDPALTWKFIHLTRGERFCTWRDCWWYRLRNAWLFR